MSVTGIQVPLTLLADIHLLHMPIPGTPISKTGGKIYLMGLEQGEVSFKYQHRSIHLDARD